MQEELAEALNTPAMRQFVEIKSKYTDSIIFFRLGDFYEMFMEDAIEASAILDIALTKKMGKIPMCGIPYHAMDNYISRLISANKKVVICEQIKNEESTTKVLQREVVRVVTPGMIIEENLINGYENNFFCLALFYPNQVLLAIADVSTADLYYFYFKQVDNYKIISVLSKFQPREIFLFDEHRVEWNSLIRTDEYVFSSLNRIVNEIPNYDPVQRFDCLKQTIHSILGYNFKKDNFEFKSPIVMEDSEYLEMDEDTVKNLDLIDHRMEREKHHTLFHVLNKCSTQSGKRLLKKRILYPFRSIEVIQDIWTKINKFQVDRHIQKELLTLLQSCADIERILARFRGNKALPRDFRTILKYIEIAKSLKLLLNSMEYRFEYQETKLDTLYEYIKERLFEGELPPILGGNGEFIKFGYSPKLDKSKIAKSDGKDWIIKLEEKEKARTGLSTLKIKYNKVVGYFIEISRNQAGNAPKDYLKKQTLVTYERFTFPELEEIERTILEADSIIEEIEKQEFDKMLLETLSLFNEFIELSKYISDLDLILSFCISADEYNWTKPEYNKEGKLNLIESRHPVIEKFLKVGERFTPNDVDLDINQNTIALLTGPNMAGKSTYMRQIALNQILFQMGSYIPAKFGSLSIVDKLFTRIGSADNITAGESTFYLEMKETARILNNKTKNSLILFDEIGRGTSTYDGLSIAWAILEYLIADKSNVTKTIFATHYHELTEMERERHIFNLYMDTVEKDGEVIFLKKVKKGRAKKSFGIYVAKLAGIPEEVVTRARELLIGLESKKREIKFRSNESEPELFSKVQLPSEQTKYKALYDKLQQIDINVLTPLEALQVLSNMKSMDI